MTNPSWPKALAEACLYAHHPALHYDTEEGIVVDFLRRWGNYSSDPWSSWEDFCNQARDDDGRFAQEIFSILQRAVTEGNDWNGAFALCLLGGLATPKTRDVLISCLNSPHRKQRWASAIALGRLKDERVFAILPTLLLEGFAVFDDEGKLEEAQEACRRYRRTIKELGGSQVALPDIWEYLREIDYEWYLRQRSECALVLGAWGNPIVVPKLSEALQAAWKMEQGWPDYVGQENADGPTIWYFFQDRLAFALGQLGAWDLLPTLSLPEKHLWIARIYLVFGYLQVNDAGIFWIGQLSHVFDDSPKYVRDRASMEKAGFGADPFVEPAQVKPLLAEHFGLSPATQEAYLAWFSYAWDERAQESGFTPLPGQWKESGQPGLYGNPFDPVFDARAFLNFFRTQR